MIIDSHEHVMLPVETQIEKLNQAGVDKAIDKSNGTVYENEKERFVQDIEDHLVKHRNDKTADTVFIHIIANNFVDGLMQIMYHYQGKEWAVMILQKLSKMYLSGIGL